MGYEKDGAGEDPNYEWRFQLAIARMQIFTSAVFAMGSVLAGLGVGVFITAISIPGIPVPLFWLGVVGIIGGISGITISIFSANRRIVSTAKNLGGID